VDGEAVMTPRHFQSFDVERSVNDGPKTLYEMGISRDQSSRCGGHGDAGNPDARDAIRWGGLPRARNQYWAGPLVPNGGPRQGFPNLWARPPGDARAPRINSRGPPPQAARRSHTGRRVDPQRPGRVSHTWPKRSGGRRRRLTS
jgi:hypothetical protein